MLYRLKSWIKNWRPFLAVTFGKIILKILLFTCKMKATGVEDFCALVKKRASILMLWHNRLVITSEILYSFAPDFIYTAVVSKSRDAEMLRRIVESYKNGRVLTVPHNDRHGALKTLIALVKKGEEIAVITPDGPRGPRYNLKPGIVLTALETGALVFPLNWKCSSYWELNTWDGLRIPKPFSLIEVEFGKPVDLSEYPALSIEQGAEILKGAMPHDD